MFNWLRCQFKGHGWQFVKEMKVWQEGSTRPFRIYKLYQCDKCLSTKKVDL
ncbi:hypothetical protein D3C80_440280 [compost metagenome]